MKKSYLDVLYMRKHDQLERVAALYEADKSPRADTCKDCPDHIKNELSEARKHLQTINQLIEDYINIHQ